MITWEQWQAGVVVGSKTISLRYIEGYHCYDVMIDGECAKRLYEGGQREAMRRAHLARSLFQAERVYEAECSVCGRVLKTDTMNRLWPHNQKAAAPGREQEPCLGSRAQVGRP